MSQTAAVAQQPSEIEGLELSPLKQTEPPDDLEGFSRGSLETGDQIFSDTQRRFDSYGFEGRTGETMRITVKSEAFIPVIFLVDETTGEVIGNQIGEAGTVMLTQELPRDGSYVLRVTATEVPGEGDYQFRVARVQTVTGSETEADRRFEQGGQQYNSGQLQAAIASWEEALRIYQEIGNSDKHRLALINLSLAHQGLGQYEQAIQYMQQNLLIVRELISTQGMNPALRTEEGRALGGLGLLYRESGQYEQAIDVLEQRIQIAREIGDRAGEGSGLGNLGLAYDGLGQYEQALEAYEQRLVIARELNQPDRESLTLGNMAETYISLGEIETAIELLQQALDIAREISDSDQEARILARLESLSAFSTSTGSTYFEVDGVLGEASEEIVLGLID